MLDNSVYFKQTVGCLIVLRLALPLNLLSVKHNQKGWVMDKALGLDLGFKGFRFGFKAVFMISFVELGLKFHFGFKFSVWLSLGIVSWFSALY